MTWLRDDLDETVGLHLYRPPAYRYVTATVTDPQRLRAALEQIRGRGYAISLQERVAGISTLAVPIFNEDHEVPASTSVSGPSTRLTEARLYKVSDLACRAVETVSAHLGYLAAIP